MNLIPNMTLIADSLGWAVLHSLWQGALAAGIVFAVRNLTRERASEIRYFTGIVTLCALLCTFISTFLYYYYTGAATISASIGGAETITLTLPGVAETMATNPLIRLGDFTGLIGLFWIVCFTVLGTRYLSAFRLTYKLRRNGLSDLPANWQARFRALVETSGVSPKVRAYFSEHVSSPITFGFLKPIVLVPTWFFTGMTPEQCEAVLLHELAHIRRHDYLTNILQIAIKTVFFYHPAVQFICKGLDTDREHACDDFAVMLTRNPEGLATALGMIRLKAARSGGVFALSADGKDAPLMHRLKRLMGTQGTSMRKGTTRGLAATALISSAVAIVMTLGATSSQAHPHKENKIKASMSDELAGDCETCDARTTVSVNGNYYKAAPFDAIQKDNGYTYINGKKYSSKYQYSVYSRKGKDYVAKQKNGKWYLEINGNWFKIDEGLVDGRAETAATRASSWTTSDKKTAKNKTDYTYSHTKIDGRKYKTKTNHITNTTYIKVGGNWHDIDETDLDALIPVPPTPPSSSYRINDQVRVSVEARTEAALERAEETREEAAERAAEALEAAEERRQEAWERAEEAREAAVERAAEQLEASLERNEDRFRKDTQRNADWKIRDYERQIAKMERKIAKKERDLARDEARLDRDIARVERDIEKKQADFERKIEKNPYMSQAELGRMQGEIGRLQGEIGRLQGERGYGQGELGRLQGELGRLQGEIGRIQGELGRKDAAVQQKKFYKMRDRLVPQLKADGFIKSDKSKVTIKMTENDIFINGKQLPNAQEGKYCDIVSDYMKRKGEIKTIIIKPGYLHVSQKDKDGFTNYGYTHDEN